MWGDALVKEGAQAAGKGAERALLAGPGQAGRLQACPVAKPVYPLIYQGGGRLAAAQERRVILRFFGFQQVVHFLFADGFPLTVVLIK